MAGLAFEEVSSEDIISPSKTNFFKKSPIVILPYSFQHNTLKIGVRFDDAGFGNKSLHMLHIRIGLEYCSESIGEHNRGMFVGSIVIKIRDLNMRSKSHHLIANLLLKPMIIHTATIITANPSAIPAMAILMAGDETLLLLSLSPL